MQMEQVVLASVDPDCDGIGHSWQRVTVPAYLATAWRKLSHRIRKEKETDRRKCGERIHNEQLEYGWSDEIVARMLEGAKYKATIPTIYEREGIIQAIIGWAINSGQGSAYGLGESVIMTVEQFEVRVLLPLERVADEPSSDEEERHARHAIDYWASGGYYSEFHRR